MVAHTDLDAVDSAQGGDSAVIKGGNPTGTWRCLGPTVLDDGLSNGSAQGHHVGLWVRTA